MDSRCSWCSPPTRSAVPKSDDDPTRCEADAVIAENITLPRGLAQPADLTSSKAKLMRHSNGSINLAGEARNGAARTVPSCAEQAG